MEYFLFLPQMRFTLDQMVERAVAAEANGFTGIALMDHMAPPLAEDQPMWEAMTTATWLAARTATLTIGHLVLCDAFRHPALLARQAITLDHASGGRFELGIGWGSVPTEFESWGVGSTEAKVRVARLKETLEVVRLLWTGEPVDYDGEFHHLAGVQHRPAPLGRIPIVIGGSGPKTRALVAEHADWWNVPVHQLSAVDEHRGTVGAARVSVQQMVALVPSEDRRAEIVALAEKRFWGMHRSGGLVIGTVDELAAHFAGLAERGVERAYVWFADFAPPATLEAFAALTAAA